LYALRMIKDGWTTAQKLALADVLGRAAKWRGGAQFMNFVGQMFEAVEGLFTSDEEERALYVKAPEFAPLTPEELEEIQKRQAAAGRGGRATSRLLPPSSHAVRGASSAARRCSRRRCINRSRNSIARTDGNCSRRIARRATGLDRSAATTVLRA
jgi:hypothetical protein